MKVSAENDHVFASTPSSWFYFNDIFNQIDIRLIYKKNYLRF